MQNVTKSFQVGNRLYIREELYEAIMYHCQNWWGKEKLSDLWHKKFYKSFKNAEREANKVSALELPVSGGSSSSATNVGTLLVMIFSFSWL